MYPYLHGFSPSIQNEYAIQFYKTINKLLCNLSFAGQYKKTQGGIYLQIVYFSFKIL